MFALDWNGQPRATRTSQERVVLIHCSASSARQWDGLVDQLAGFGPVPLDLHGHGDRQRWPGTGPLSLSAEAAAIEDACSGGSPFHLIGHSYGGAVALKFALGHPQRLRSLTLIEPSCFHLLKAVGIAEAKPFDEIIAIADAVNRGVICGDYRRGMATFIDYWGGEGTWANLPDARQAQFADLAVHVAHHFCSLINEDTPLSAYAAINVPTLILCGAYSPKPSRAITWLLAEALPRVWHRTIRNANHMSPITHPARVNPFILEHLLVNRGKRGPLDQLVGAQ
jgi:pimeloyl-ACP methyl ester carboxylesterase